MTFRILVWGTIVVLVGVGIFLSVQTGPRVVTAAPVVKADLVVSIVEDGITRLREKYVVSAPVMGQLTRIEFRAGDDVEAVDTLLATILPTPPPILDIRSQAQAAARVSAAQAAVERAKTSVTQSELRSKLWKAKLDRAEGLVQNQGISVNEFQTIETEYRSADQATRTAEFELQIAKFELAMAELAAKQFSAAENKGDPDEGKQGQDENQRPTPIQPFEIRSPTTGKILKVFQESTTIVNAGTPLFEVGDPAELEIVVDVLSTDAVQIHKGSSLVVENWGGAFPLQAEVRTVEPAATTKISSLGVEEQRVNIIGDFLNYPRDDARLGDGFRVEARITLEQKSSVLQIPNSALFQRQGKWFVFQIVEGRAKLQEVEIGIQNETQSEIVAGLDEDNLVITFPDDSLQADMAVQPNSAVDP